MITLGGAAFPRIQQASRVYICVYVLQVQISRHQNMIMPCIPAIVTMGSVSNNFNIRNEMMDPVQLHETPAGLKGACLGIVQRITDPTAVIGRSIKE